MQSEEKGKGFTVQDRRRFSAEGESKPEHSEEKPAPAAAAERPPAEAAHTTAAGEHLHAGIQPEVSFTTFVVGLSTQALVALGEIPDPVSGQHAKDLEAAQQLIDIIGMLREKTRGNLDNDENSLVEAILFDLRMKYVELARQMAR